MAFVRHEACGDRRGDNAQTVLHGAGIAETGLLTSAGAIVEGYVSSHGARPGTVVATPEFASPGFQAR